VTEAEPTYRQVPRNIEAEQALLGAILVNNEAHDCVSDFIETHHFYDQLHQRIYDAVSKLIALGKRANPVTLKTFFETAEPIDAAQTVPQYLGKLAANATTIINARDYGRTIQDLAIRRQMILIGEDMVNAAYDSPVDFPPKEQIEEAERRLYALVEHSERAVEVDAPTMFGAAIKAIELAHKNGGQRGLSTGSRNIDARHGKLAPGRLIILAGRPSMGKTALATELIRKQPGAVHFFSAEMTAEEIAQRMLSAESGIPAEKLQKGEIDAAQWRVLLEAEGKLAQQPLIVDPTGGISIVQLMARARRVKRKTNTTLIVVDYLQLMKGSARAENRTVEVGEISRGLKALAKELEIPVLALSQLSRATDARDDKRPHLADLRVSGSIEQDADSVMFVFREEYYVERKRPSLEDSTFADWAAKMERARGTAEVIVAKNRHGAVGTAMLQFDSSITRFSDLAFGHEVPNGAATAGYPAGRAAGALLRS
jgi:replicative DNA helicase